MEKIDPNNHQRNTDTKNNDGLSESNIPKSAISNDPKKHQTEDINKNTDPKRKWISLLRKPSVTDWLIVAITLIICYIAYLQWQTAEKSDQTTRLRDRAFINFSNPTLKVFPKYNPPRMTINITAQNTGNVPAKNVLIDYDCLIVEKSKDISDPFKIAKFRKARIPQFMGPKQIVGFAAMDVERDAFMDRMLKEGIKVYVVVKTEYLDGFDPDHKRTTQMSRQFHFDAAKLHSFSFAGSHNCIDDDCNGN